MFQYFRKLKDLLLTSIPPPQKGIWGVGEGEQRKLQQTYWNNLYKAYSIVIDSFAQDGQPNLAVDWFRRMQCARVNPTTSIFNSVEEKFGQQNFRVLTLALRADALAKNIL